MSKQRDDHGRFLFGADGVHREVPVDQLRDAFLRSGISASELARRLGWMRPDSIRIQRQLGLMRHSNGQGYTQIRETMSLSRALEIIEALDIDPREAGL